MDSCSGLITSTFLKRDLNQEGGGARSEMEALHGGRDLCCEFHRHTLMRSSLFVLLLLLLLVWVVGVVLAGDLF